MFKLYIVVILLLPLIGLYSIEQNGYFGGYPNNSIWPYTLYLLCFYLSYKFIFKKTLKKQRIIKSNARSFRHVVLSSSFKRKTLLVLVVLLLISLFAFNGLNVITGKVHKGEFRVQLGYLGFLMAIPTKFIFPAVFTRFCFLYYHNKTKIYNKYRFDGIFYLMCIIAVLFGLTFGDKSMAVTNLLCGMIALFWERTKVSHLIIFSLTGFGLFIFTAYLFDSFLSNSSLSQVIDYLSFRAFALSAESSWKVWDLHLNNKLDFNYFYTLFGILGSGGIYLLFGVGKFESEAYMFNFGKAVTALLYPNSIPLINSGVWNITPSAYVEGILIGGVIGVAAIGLIAGSIYGYIKRIIVNSVDNGDYAKASVFIVYFIYAFSTWIITGGITTLIHPITLFGSIIAFRFIRYIEKKIV